MAQKTYKQIEAEANQKFGKGASSEKFAWRRQQQEAAGLEKESKKRGGVAGTYDRNKGLIQAAIPTLAGMLIPGAGLAAGAIAGGLARGVDRPGKGGIGLDLGQAAKGAITGAGMGQLGSGLRTAASNMMANRAASQAAKAIPGLPAQAPMIETPMPGMGAGAPPAASAPMAPSAPSAIRAGGTAIAPPRVAGAIAPPPVGGMPAPAPVPPPTAPPGMMGKMLGGLKEYAPVIQAGAGAVADVLGQRSQQKIEEQRLAQQQEQFQKGFDVNEEERRRLREQQNRLASLFMPRSA